MAGYKSVPDGAAEVISTNGKSILVDAEDLPLVTGCGRWMAILKGYVWYAGRTIYVGEKGKKKGRRVYMHRILLPDSQQVDHINGNGLDNRRANLRAVTPAENRRNRPAQSNSKSGVRGVVWNKRLMKWEALLRHQRKSLHLGFYPTIEEARAVYLKKAAELWSPLDMYRDTVEDRRNG